MSLKIGLVVCLTFLVACESKEPTAIAPKASEVIYFSPAEVITTLNALVGIIDYPTETALHQRNLSVNLEEAKKLMLPLHPLWDEKISELSGEMPGWDKAKIKSVAENCARTCACDFYQEVLDKNPTVLESSPELRVLSDIKFEKTKAAVLECLNHMGSIQKVLNHLRSEQKIYEATETI